MSTPFDPGLQPERTELAWRRTALALGVGSLISLRLLPAAFGNAWWALAGAAGLAASGLVWVWARRRYRAVNAVLTTQGDRGLMPGAGILLALAGITFAASIAGAAIVVAIANGSPS